MNQNSLNVLETHERSYDFLMLNQAVWSTYKPLVKQVAILGNSIQERKKAHTAQQVKVQGATATKGSAQKKAIDLTTWLAKLANAYALDSHETDLYAQTRRNSGYLANLPDEQAVAVMQQMLDSISGHMTALVDYGATAADLTAAQTAVAAAEAELTAPRSVVDTKKTAGQNIKIEERTGRTALTVIDKVIHYFDKSNPDFVKTYRNTRVKIDRRGGSGDTPPTPPQA